MTDPERVRIAVLTPWRTDDPSAWSGIVLPMLRALETVAEVSAISTADVPTAFVDRLAARLSRKRYLWSFGLATSRARGRVASRRVRAADVGVVFAVAASVDVAHLGGSVPVVQYVDAGFEDMRDRYSVFTGLSRLSAAQVRRVGVLAARRTTGYVAASAWAADGLVRSGVDRARVVVAPPGAAIPPSGDRPSSGSLSEDAGGDRLSSGSLSEDGAPATTETKRADPAAARVSSRSSFVGARSTTPGGARSATVGGGAPLEVLVVASDWERKGGDRALAAVDAARAAGAEIALTVVGRAPALPDDVRVPGRLTAAELSDEYERADVLLELARANAAGVTLTDAAAHGLPAIATDTGGVPSIVAEGLSGWLVPNEDEAAIARAARLLVALSRGEQSDVSRRSAAAHYAEALDWPRWAEQVVAMCTRVAQEDPR